MHPEDVFALAAAVLLSSFSGGGFAAAEEWSAEKRSVPKHLVVAPDQ